MNILKKSTYPLFESISFKNGEFRLAEYHLRRIERSTMKHFGTFRHQNIFKNTLPFFQKDIQYKCHIDYNEDNFELKFSEYHRKKIEKIKIVESPNLNYTLKYSDRSVINNLKSTYPDYDEILITQNGFICDTSIANVVLEKNGKLFTPETCLLKGVQRAYLLDQGLIVQRQVHINELHEYDFLIPINAMNSIDEAKKINTNKIEN